MNRIALIVLLLAASLCGCKNEAPHGDEELNQKADSISVALNSKELKELNAQILADPSSAALYNQRSRLYMSLKLPTEAASDAKRAIRIDSNRAEYYLTLVDAYFAANSTRLAKELLEVTEKKFPENVEGLLKLAELYFIVRQYQKGIDYVNRALKIDDRNARAYYIKGSIYRESGDTARAVSSLETAVEQDNRYVDAYYDLGVIYAAKKDPLALQYYDNVLRIEPGNVNTLYAKAKLLQDIGQPDPAIGIYKSILDGGQGCPHCEYNIGAIYLNIKKDRKEALAWFSRAIKSDPEYAEAWFARGYTWSLMGEKDKARADYQRCLQIRPDFEAAVTGLNAL